MGSRLIFHFNLAQSKSTSAILSHDGTIPKDIVQRSIHAHCSAKMFCCLCSFIHYLFLAYDLSIRIRCYLKILNQRIVCHWMFCYVIIYSIDLNLLQRNYFPNFSSDLFALSKFINSKHNNDLTWECISFRTVP